MGAKDLLTKLTLKSGHVVSLHRFSSGAPLACLRVGSKQNRHTINVDEARQLADALNGFVDLHESTSCEDRCVKGCVGACGAPS